MVWKTLLGYTSVLSLAGQSARWERAMNEKLMEMASAAGKAASLQASAAEHQAMGTEAQEAAAAEEAQAVELQAEAAALMEKSEADAAIAAGEQVEVEALEAQVTVEEEESAAHAAAAALDETTFDSEMAEATADAVEAARSEAQAHGEEAGIAVCEFVPFLDIACDIIGGITAVGMEGLAASETVKASTEFAAATATKTEEEREVAFAAELQGKAAEDGTAAAELQGEEAAEAELAEEERIAGEEKEAQADALTEDAETEEETAGEEEAQAAEQEEQASSMASRSVLKGVQSLWDAIMASVFGAISFLFFGFRFTAKIIRPAISVVANVWSSPSTTTIPTTSTAGMFARDASYNIHHCGIFILLAGCFSNLFHVLGESSLKARGGIILGFAMTGAGVQIVLLHSLPARLSKTQSLGTILLHALRLVLSLSILYTLEILIVWAAFGQTVFTMEWLKSLDRWFWWLLLLLPLVFHWFQLEVPFLLSKHRDIPNGDTCCGDQEQGKLLPTEKNSLLPSKYEETTASSSSLIKSPKGWFANLWEDLGKMQLPFEILLLTCMSSLLIHCLGAAESLWPASKSLLLSVKPDWLVPLGIAMAVILVAGLALVIPCPMRYNGSR